MKTKQLTAVTLALALAACDQGTGPLRRSITFPPNGNALAITRLGPWHTTGFDAARRQVITDRATYLATWDTLHRWMGSPPPAPPVDFGEEVVVLVGMGTRPTAGYTIEIARATDDGTGRYIEVAEASPGSSCGVADVITSPADAVVLPAARDLTVRFVEVRKTHDC